MLKPSILAGLFCATVIAGCGVRTSPVRVDAHHPADPRAPEAPVAASVRLEPDAFDRAIVAESSDVRPDSAAPSPSEDRAAPSHHHGVPASPGSGERPSTDSTSTHMRVPDSATYVCPMHLEVTDTKASECPKCGMTLVRRKEKP